MDSDFAACFQVLTAAGSREEAAAIADGLLRRRLAACVQVLGPVESRYWWKGAIESAEEWLCLAKTTATALDDAMAEVRRLHSYETPEILALPVSAGDPAYLAWLAAEVGHSPPNGGAPGGS